MVSLILIPVCIFVFIIFNIAKLKHFYKIVRFSHTLPGPSIKEFLANKNPEDFLRWMKECRLKYGSRFRIWMGKDLSVFFSDPEDVKVILSSNQILYKANNYRFMEPWLGKGLLTSGGDDWHRQRKLLTPAFHFRNLSEFKPQIDENCNILIKKMNELADETEFDVYPYITLYALDVICETAMGVKRNAQIESDSEYVKAVQTICRVITLQTFSLLGRIPFLFNRTSNGKIRDDALKVLHGETYGTIENRRSYMSSERYSESKVRTFLDILLISQRTKNNISNESIREEVDTFLFEGHDTTSSAIGFAVYQLSINPEIQQRAYEEALEMTGREKESMEFMEAVIKETLRLYPSVPLLARILDKDTNISGKIHPKGTSVTVVTYMVHRDERYFPDPEKFDPFRFLDQSNDIHPFAFIPFSAGPRNCIGQKFAMLELKTTLSVILRNFEILPAVDFKPLQIPELIIKSANGIRIRLRKR